MPAEEPIVAQRQESSASKRCARCHTLLPLDRFRDRRRRRITGETYLVKQSSCRECQNAYHRAHRRKWMTPERSRRYNFAARTRLKDAVFSHYGKVCVACGEDDLTVLSIDHVHNDGAEHRRRQFGWVVKDKHYQRPPSGYWLYNWLKQNNFPDGFQTLCLNCNMAKHVNKGVIPPKRIHFGSPFFDANSNHSAADDGGRRCPQPRMLTLSDKEVIP